MINAIYFITDLQYIKIGYTKNIQKRLKQLSTGNSKRLYILYTIPNGTIEQEKEFHKCYKQHHLEWFDPADASLIDFINTNNKNIEISYDGNKISIYQKMKHVK